MPKASPLQSNFGSGEVSPLFQGRVEAERYRTALDTCLNYVPTIQGGLIRRSGSSWVAEAKDSTKKSRLQKFEFSTTQAYMIEFGHMYIRFYRNYAPVLEAAKTITGATAANPVVITSNAHGFSNGDDVEISGVVGMTQLNGRRFRVANVAANTFELKTLDGTNLNGTGFTAYSSGGTASRVYTVASLYEEEDLFQLNFTQSADVLYIFHPLYQQRKLTRTDHTAWTLAVITTIDGPYLQIQQQNNGSFNTAITITPSAATGAITLTASAALFVSTDVDRLVRLKVGSNSWGYARITGYTSTTVVNATVINTLTAASATSNWRLGVWSDTTGYPATGCFHEDRLFQAGPTFFPQRFDASVVGDYDNYSETAVDGTHTAENAFFSTLNANDVNAIRWLTSDEKGLLSGTTGGEWIIRASTQGDALTPDNVSQKRASSYGSANIQPVQVGKSTLFVQRSTKKLRELLYFYDVDGFQANDMTLLAEHISGPGFTQLAFQKEPISLVWAVRTDGVLTAMTYERDIEALRAGWSRHIAGGVSDAADSDAIVESVDSIPSEDGTREDLWLIVRRWVNGRQVRYIEYINKFFDVLDEQKDAKFSDSLLTYDEPKTITGATSANPVVITASSHGFSNGDVVLISDLKGMNELNGNTYTVANVTTHTFQLSGVNGTSYSTYVSGGEVRKYITTISGLWHLIGQTVSVLADGAVLPDEVVNSSGMITLSNRATTVQVGLSFNSDGKLLRLEAGSADGTALGKTRRTHRVGMMLYRTLGLSIGYSFDELDELTFRTSADPMSRAPELFTGIISESMDSGYDFENQFCWRQNQPLPGLIQAIMPQMVTQDRG